MKVKFHPEARQEFEDAVLWYETQSLLAAKRFVSNVQSVLSRVQFDPESFAMVLGPCRRCRVSEFPFEIYFVVTEETVCVQAVAHCSRRPEYWKSRKIGD